MTTYMPARPEVNKPTHSYPGAHKDVLAISSPTVSPTYDLLDGYSDADGAHAKRPAPKAQMSMRNGLEMENHHEVWRQINQAHDGLVAQRTKEKGDPGASSPSLQSRVFAADADPPTR